MAAAERGAAWSGHATATAFPAARARCRCANFKMFNKIKTKYIFVLMQSPMMNGAREEIVLPSLGEAGEVVNAVATALLNAVTVYKFQ